MAKPDITKENTAKQNDAKNVTLKNKEDVKNNTNKTKPDIIKNNNPKQEERIPNSNTEGKEPSEDDSRVSYTESNHEHVQVTSMHVDWKIRHDKFKIEAFVILEVKQIKNKETQLKLDLDESLKIIQVLDGKTLTPLQYKKEQRRYRDKVLIIKLPNSFDYTKKCSVVVKYKKRSPEGLQVAIKEKQFLMYSQFEYLRGRNMFPCQDSPTYKVRFSASIHTDKNLEVLMSGKHVKTKQRPGSNMKTVYFINPYHVPIYCIGFVIGRFYIYELEDNVTVYVETKVSDFEQFKKITEYRQMISQLVGEDPWRELDVVLTNTPRPCTYPYLSILSYPDLVPDNLFNALAHSWFRSTITVNNIQDLWLQEAFPTYIARRLTARESNEFEIEEKIDKATHKYNQVSLQFKARVYSDPEIIQVIAERGWLCLVVLEHYGGVYGEFTKLVRLWYEENKFQEANLNTLVKLSDTRLHFDDAHEFKTRQKISKFKDWIESGAPIPKKFQERTKPLLQTRQTVDWLMLNTKDNTKTAVRSNTTYPLVYLTPAYVNYRMRKRLLMHHLLKYERGKLADHTKVFEILGDNLNMNCLKDEILAVKFLKLSIQHRQVNQLEVVQNFVNNNSNIENLVEIMRLMLKWEKAVRKHTLGADEFNYMPMMQEIVKTCDTKLEKLISAEEVGRRTLS